MARRKDDPAAQRGTENAPGRGSSKAAADPSPRQARGGARREPAARPLPAGGRATQVRVGIGGAPIVVPLTIGGITIDGAQLMIERNGLCSWFTPVEWRLLCVFLRNPGAVLNREELAEQAWGVTDEEGYGAVNVYISRVRRKLDPTPGRS